MNRLEGIGASEVPAIAGVSPWTTPAGLWLAKVGLGGPDRDTAPMRMGQVLERTLVRALGDDLGYTFRHNQVTFRHPDWPAIPLYATPDGFGPHRRSLVEIKVVGHHWDAWKDGPPEYVRLQALAQLAVLQRAQRVHVGALLGSEVRAYVIDRDQEAIDTLEAEVARWWAAHVLAEVAPDPEGPSDVWALLRARAAGAEDRPDRIATDDEEVLAAHLAVLMDQRADLDALADGVRRELAQAAGDANLAGRGWRATWSSRRSTDWRTVAQLFAPPRDIEAHTTAAPVFTFRRDVAQRPALQEALP